ncbi:hypothetical protein N7G274_000534 [Stereocaulon virgatum]|uniref:Uncharacterized protein n=1 Tax=Stereocaulon virgatum TaxID=373712 RepID=A0ABR4ASE2_9LECA
MLAKIGAPYAQNRDASYFLWYDMKAWRTETTAKSNLMAIQVHALTAKCSCACFVGGFDSMQASLAKESRTSMLDCEGIMTFDTDLKSEKGCEEGWRRACQRLSSRHE